MANHKWTEETDAIDRATKRALAAIGIVISGDAITRAPVDTGRLRGSITYAVRDKQSAIQTPAKENDKIKRPHTVYELYIGTNVEYSQHIEYGTRFMGAQPYLRPALDHNRKNAQQIFSKELSRAFQGK